MKRQTAILLLITLIGITCKKDKITANDLIQSLTFSSQHIDADGVTTVIVTATLNPKADAARRTVIFTATGGSWAGGKDSTISATAGFIGGQLIAQAALQAPSSPDTILVKARVDLPQMPTDYSRQDTVFATASVPVKLSLSADSFAVKVNFGDEITLTAKLVNASGKPASSGNLVSFADLYNDHVTAINGRFRPSAQVKSNANGLATVVYSPGNISSGITIWIRCSIVNANPAVSPDSVFINTISNN
jgi:hypothetical protein